VTTSKGAGKRTRLQFGEGEEPTVEAGGEACSSGPALRCPSCRSRFTAEAARFCPFDGEALEEGPAEVAVDPLIGQTVDDRYVVVRVLGEGGMGTVYEVRHASLDRPFAMKVLRLDLAKEAELGARFTREARAAAAIDHPNVVQITDFGALRTGQPYFVMELLEGKALAQLLRSGPMPTDRALRILSQVAQGLEAAHQAGIIHRDLKPDNVIVLTTARGDVVKVVDFGLARVAGQSRLTKGGMVFGTPHYMSPEQATGAELDARSDQYALGVILYEAATGSVPFEADTYMGVMTQHVYAEPRPPRERIGHDVVSADLEAVILECLAKDPNQRFESMGVLSAILDSLVDGEVGVTAGWRSPAAPPVAYDPFKPAPRPAVRSPSRHGPLGPVAAACVVLIAGVVTAAWLLRMDPPAHDAISEPAKSPPAVGSAGPIQPVFVAAPPAGAPATPAPEKRALIARSQTNSRSATTGALPSSAVESRAGAPAEPGPARAPERATRPPRPDPRFHGSEIVDPWSQ
jgi:predicted Ser/Thr protein kinase